MATGKSCSRWFAAMAALLMVVSLSGCFDKEGDQRKAFIDFLGNDSNLLIVFYVQIMPDDFVMQLHRF